MQRATRSSSRQLRASLGGSGDWDRRLLVHHGPLALASAVILVLSLTLPSLDINEYALADIFSDSFPQERDAGQFSAMEHAAGQMSSPQGAGQAPPQHGAGQMPPQQGAGHQMPQQQSGGQTGSIDRSGDQTASPPPGPVAPPGGSSTRRLTTSTGYIALVLLGLTLLIGPANLLLRRRNPVSNYLRRDLGTWTAISSVVHVVFGLQVHGGGELSVDGILSYFVVDGSPLTNSFGLGNWTGLAATVIVVGLLALSSDFALRKLKAGPWKWLQRLNYALFALVVLHALFYGALVRLASPFTLLLGLSVIAVFVGQAVGIWLWRRRHARRWEYPAVALVLAVLIGLFFVNDARVLSI